MNEPTDFVSMCFNHNLVLGLRIYYPYSGSIRIDEHFVYDDNTTQDRTWTITLGETGHFTATAPDVKGTAKGRNVGATVQSKYTIRLPDDVGGHLLNTVDWMYLTGDGTIINRSQFRKFGVKVAELVATIRRKDAA